MPRRPSATDQTAALTDLLLMQQAQRYSLDIKSERNRSRDDLQGLFADLQAVIQPQFTVEIGAFTATFSQLMAGMGITAHAFEANPYNYEKFRARIAASAPAVRYHHLALSDRDGEVSFHVKDTKGGQTIRKEAGNNSLLQRNDASYGYETVSVPATRLDSFLAANGLNQGEFSAWIDVEGALHQVTGGFGSALEHCLSLIVEVEETAYWKDQMLVGDAMRYFGAQGLVPVARDFESRHQYNLVYLRADMLGKPGVRLALTRFFQKG